MAKTKRTGPTASPAADAMAAGDGPAFASALASKKKPETIKALGRRADNSRWDVRIGRALLGASELLLALPDEVVRDFLPTLAIAAVRERHYENAARRAHADQVIARLRPFVERSEWVADMIARSGCHYVSAHDSPAHAKDMLEIARACPAMADNAWFKKLTGEVQSTK